MRLRSAAELKEEAARREQKKEEEYLVANYAEYIADLDRATAAIEAAQENEQQACNISPPLFCMVSKKLRDLKYEVIECNAFSSNPFTYVRWV